MVWKRKVLQSQKRYHLWTGSVSLILFTKNCFCPSSIYIQKIPSHLLLVVFIGRVKDERTWSFHRFVFLSLFVSWRVDREEKRTVNNFTHKYFSKRAWILFETNTSLRCCNTDFTSPSRQTHQTCYESSSLNLVKYLDANHARYVQPSSHQYLLMMQILAKYNVRQFNVFLLSFQTFDTSSLFFCAVFVIKHLLHYFTSRRNGIVA